jgi:hypothetical protein
MLLMPLTKTFSFFTALHYLHSHDRLTPFSRLPTADNIYAPHYNIFSIYLRHGTSFIITDSHHARLHRRATCTPWSIIFTRRLRQFTVSRHAARFIMFGFNIERLFFLSSSPRC